MDAARNTTLTKVSSVPLPLAQTTTSASDSLFQTVPYARAIEAAGGEVYLLHVEDEAGWVGHTTFIAQRMLGHTTWIGLAHPNIRDENARQSFWLALAREGRRTGALAIAWRENAIARLTDADVVAARAASTDIDGVIQLGSLGTHVLTLETPERAWTKFHRKHRNIIRKAEAHGFRAGPAPDDDFVQTYANLSKETFARSNAPGPAEPYFRALLSIRESDFTPRAYLARDESGTPVAGAIIAEDRSRSATYLHGASHGATGASNLLQWTIIQDLCARGIREYDFGGAAIPGSPADDEKATGIRRFKERFGGAWQCWPQLQLQFDPAGYAEARAQARAAAERAAREASSSLQK